MLACAAAMDYFRVSSLIVDGSVEGLNVALVDPFLLDCADIPKVSEGVLAVLDRRCTALNLLDHLLPYLWSQLDALPILDLCNLCPRPRHHVRIHLLKLHYIIFLHLNEPWANATAAPRLAVLLALIELVSVSHFSELLELPDLAHPPVHRSDVVLLLVHHPNLLEHLLSVVLVFLVVLSLLLF